MQNIVEMKLRFYISHSLDSIWGHYATSGVLPSTCCWWSQKKTEESAVRRLIWECLPRCLGKDWEKSQDSFLVEGSFDELHCIRMQCSAAAEVAAEWEGDAGTGDWHSCRQSGQKCCPCRVFVWCEVLAIALVGAQWLRPSIAGSVRAGMQGAKDYEKGEHVQGVVLTTDGLLGEFNAYYLHKAENWNPGLYEINSLQPAAGPAAASTKTQVCINDTWSARVHLRAPQMVGKKPDCFVQLWKVEQPVVAHQICWCSYALHVWWPAEHMAEVEQVQLSSRAEGHRRRWRINPWSWCVVSWTSWHRGRDFDFYHSWQALRRASMDNWDLVSTGLAHHASYFSASFGLTQKELAALFLSYIYNFIQSRIPEFLYFPIMQNPAVLGCFRLTAA